MRQQHYLKRQVGASMKFKMCMWYFNDHRTKALRILSRPFPIIPFSRSHFRIHFPVRLTWSTTWYAGVLNYLLQVRKCHPWSVGGVLAEGSTLRNSIGCQREGELWFHYKKIRSLTLHFAQSRHLRQTTLNECTLQWPHVFKSQRLYVAFFFMHKVSKFCLSGMINN